MTADEFERHRGRIFGLAYRMLGSAHEAEDVVQDAFLRWHGAGPVHNPAAWLTTVATNLCLNRLSSARARRERYVGPWLPEPVLTEDGALGPLDTAERRDSVSLALLVLLDRLTPTERAVFVLREAFGYPHREVAGVVGVSEANSRQLHRRAQARLADHRPPAADVPAATHRALLERFLLAAQDGDLAGLEALLADGVTSVADGGGQVAAARKPVQGAGRVAPYLVRTIGRVSEGVEVRFAEVNGAVAVVALVAGVPLGVLAAETDGTRIHTIRMQANPDKLAYLGRQLTDR